MRPTAMMMMMYQKARETWGNHLSQYFTQSNGVKQGGVLSPTLFTYYIDNLFVRNQSMGVILEIYLGALSYAII